jgi:hypothetical protein
VLIVISRDARSERVGVKAHDLQIVELSIAVDELVTVPCLFLESHESGRLVLSRAGRWL